MFSNMKSKDEKTVVITIHNQEEKEHQESLILNEMTDMEAAKTQDIRHAIH